MLGWRGAFAYISPSTIELPWELQDMLPDGVKVIATVLGVRAHSDAEFERAQQQAQAAVEAMVSEGAQAVILGGVPFAARQGYARERALHAAWSERLGTPVISSVAAAVAALEHLRARRPIVATAYLESLNRSVQSYLEEAGLEVAGIEGLAVRTPAEASRIEPTAFYELARRLAIAHPEADSIFLGVRGNLYPVAVQLEQDLGLPVVYGTQSGLWWALRQLRIWDDDLEEYGRLFSP